MAKKKRVPKPKPETDPQDAMDVFLLGIPAGFMEDLPQGFLSAADEEIAYVLGKHPQLQDNTFILALIVSGRMRRRARREVKAGNVGWEFDEDRCRAFMDLLIEYLPIFIALI